MSHLSIYPFIEGTNQKKWGLPCVRYLLSCVGSDWKEHMLFKIQTFHLLTLFQFNRGRESRCETLNVR